MPQIDPGKVMKFGDFLSDHEILYCVSYPKLQEQCALCDAYFMVVIGIGVEAPLLICNTVTYTYICPPQV